MRGLGCRVLYQFVVRRRGVRIIRAVLRSMLELIVASRSRTRYFEAVVNFICSNEVALFSA